MLRRLTLVFLLATASANAMAEDYSSLPRNERVMVVYNAWTKESGSVARYYMAKRHIPATNKCALKIDDRQSQNYVGLQWEEVETVFKKPIKKCLQVIGKNKILYIVFTYGVPFQTYRPRGEGVALDQYVADIWDEVSNPGREENPYHIALHGSATRPPFLSLAAYRALPRAKNVYSVWRLDGHTAQEAKGLVDKALEAEAKGLRGQVCIDRRNPENLEKIPEFGYGEGEWALQRAADYSREAGFSVVMDTNLEEFGTAPAPVRCDNAALYAGWYKLNNYNDAFTWNVGAIGIHLDSSSAESPRGGKNWAANALSKGITVTAGAVDEPYLQGLPSPDVIFAALFEGANVGDAFLRGERWLKWQLINIGDPLYRPFPNGRPKAIRK
jgi:uncharacterized protein (TIGR03790 family)